MNRERLLSNVEDDEMLKQDEALRWTEWFADPANPEHLHSDRLAADRQRLADELAHLIAWADKAVALLDPTKPERVLLHSEIGDAFQALGDMLDVVGAYWGSG